MSKRSPKKNKRRSKSLPALGFAGVSLSMASGACASVSEATANTPPNSPSHSNTIVLGEEEISDVSLATFYVYDKENVGSAALSQKLMLARGMGGCGCGHGCGGCGGGGMHVGCGGGGMHVGCAVGGCGHGCAVGGCGHACAVGGCRCAGFGRCRCGVGCRCGGFFFGGCVGCVGCAACATDSCWAFIPVLGWVYTCSGQLTPPGETSPAVASNQSAPVTEVVAKVDETIAGTRTK